jgi:hypothetical protein
MSVDPDPRLGTVLELVAEYVRGDRTDDELLSAVRADPALAPLEAACLRCSGLAQELLEAVGRSPFDDDLPFAGPPAPSREGLERWLERVRSGAQEASALCDWAADALAWQDPSTPMDPVVEEILTDVLGSEDDVLELVHDDARLELTRWHLEHTPPDRAEAVAVGATVYASRDELLVALVSRTSGITDDAALRVALAPALGVHRKAMPGLLEDLVAAAVRLAEAGAELDTVERFLDRLARTGDPTAALTSDDDRDDPELRGPR